MHGKIFKRRKISLRSGEGGHFRKPTISYEKYRVANLRNKKIHLKE
jgi:hypothetical protein